VLVVASVSALPGNGTAAISGQGLAAASMATSLATAVASLSMATWG